MIVNISYIEFEDVLKNNMWYTAEPFYKNIDIEFDSLSDLVCSDYRQVSPYYYKFRQKNTYGWCNSRQNLLILDIDDGMTISDIQILLEHHTYLIYTTKSHQKDKHGLICDRFRLIIPAENIPRDDTVYFTMLRLLRHRFKSDKQTETKSAGFLGNSNAKVYKNKGRTFNCGAFADKAETIVALESKAKIIEQELKEEARKTYSQEFMSTRVNVAEIKEQLDLEIMIEIVDSLGIEVTSRGKCSIREERSPSTQLYADGGVHDFGGDSTDIFGLIMDKTGISFRDSIDYVCQYLRK